MLTAATPWGLEAQLPSQVSPSAGISVEEESFEYKIGHGDILQISVWRENDFSSKVTVRFDGKITLPLAGDIEAAGRTPEQLGTELEETLAEFIESPQVTVSVDVPNSARYFVIGKVQTQGAFPFMGPLRVMQALALAGGFRDFAKKGDIFVLREVEGRQKRLPVQYERLEEGKYLETNIMLRPGDTIVVP
jgi:polysaccharide export outer membrane protein